MNSFDTNILFYFLNQDAPESQPAYHIIRQALDNPGEWIIADQVYFELYRLIRQPTVLERPLTGTEAFRFIDHYRNKTGWLTCDYRVTFWNDMVRYLENDAMSSSNIFDLRLAVTLKNNNVQKLYTRNVKDFIDFSWFEVIDPIR